MSKVKKIFNRIICVVVLSVVLTVLFFFSFNRPKIVKAEPFTIGAMGIYALVTAVGAYFAGTGVNWAINNNSNVPSNNQNDIINQYVGNWVSEHAVNSNNELSDYFNDSGEYIGSQDDFTVVQDERNGVLNFIFGKDLAERLELLKRDFIQNKQLSSVPVAVTPDNVIVTSAGNYPVYNSASISGYPVSLITANDHDSVGVVLDDSHSFVLSHSYYSATRDQMVCAWGQTSEFRTYDPNYHFSVFLSAHYNSSIPTNSYLRVGLIRNAGEELVEFGPNWKLIDLPNLATFSLEGSLVDGYSDLEDALDDDLAEATEDNVIVVQSDEQDVPLTFDQIFPGIFGGTIAANYDGVAEDRDTVVNEVEGKPFVPVLPEGWVQVEGLQTFFPFCIPFDFYEIIKMLNVPPEAPKFAWKMNFGNTGIDDYDAEIDLSPYETVASVFRIMVVIVFLIFLTIKTRDLIRG